METISPAGPQDLEDLLPMSTDLWPDYTRAELEEALARVLASNKFQILLYRSGTEATAFIYVGIRTDYVEGSDTSPTGYLEGIYVKPTGRHTGIARKLLVSGESWLREQGCTQMGSDIYVDNQVSYAFHSRSGFQEAGRLIAFIKDL